MFILLSNPHPNSSVLNSTSLPHPVGKIDYPSLIPISTENQAVIDGLGPARKRRVLDEVAIVSLADGYLE